SGKDQTQRAPLKLMPPKDIIPAHDITAQALYYGKPGWLMNKIVVGGERKHDDSDANRDRTSAIRQMLSQGFIDKLTVIDGETKSIHQQGPISYSETSTRDSIFDEDANRCLLLRTDDSAKLTRQVLQAQGRNYEPGPTASSAEIDAIRARHWGFQDAL